MASDCRCFLKSYGFYEKWGDSRKIPTSIAPLSFILMVLYILKKGDVSVKLRNVGNFILADVDLTFLIFITIYDIFGHLWFLFSGTNMFQICS